MFPRRDAGNLYQGAREADVSPFSLDELKEALKNMKIGKSPGPDGIPPEAIKMAGMICPEMLMFHLNGLLSDQEFPQNWKTAKLVLIPEAKKQPMSQPNTDLYVF